MPPPVPSIPVCPCPGCEEARKTFGLILSKCGLVPAAHADFLAEYLDKVCHAVGRALAAVRLEISMNKGGLDVGCVTGSAEVLNLALMLSVAATPGEFERYLPTAEKLAAARMQQARRAIGAN